MAHYALIDTNNLVVQVITGVDENTTQIDLDGKEVGGSTEAWETFYANLPWFNGLTCKRTSYNNNIRKRYAGIGDTYNETLDAFITPKPYASWILNEETCDWEAPVARPNGEGIYNWNESTLSWDLLE